MGERARRKEIRRSTCSSSLLFFIEAFLFSYFLPSILLLVSPYCVVVYVESFPGRNPARRDLAADQPDPDQREVWARTGGAV